MSGFSPLLMEAVSAPETGAMNASLVAQHLFSAVIFSALGILVFGAAVLLVQKITPFSVRKEIEEDQNMAFAVILGAMILGISIIIAASIVG
jgi:putative membrane protein